ncbi:uncharacterized protein LOC142973855 [Anticarsia gemmatalis]|uniref:uncharacterized protein LOC142973855 n=1 Tax=Anticarsia gemmatalis TaxID=129554 RepID=UPI003F7708EC
MAWLKSSFFVATVVLAVCGASPIEDRNLPLKVPTPCKGRGFCTIEPEGYAALVEKINKAMPQFLLQEYDDRNGPESAAPEYSPENDWHNCPSVTTTESIYLYNKGENSTKIDIIVQTELFRQYIKVVSCAHDKIDADSDEQCFKDLGISAFNMRSQCVTTNARRTLYVYDDDRGKIIQKSYEVPACCSCKVQNKV